MNKKDLLKSISQSTDVDGLFKLLKKYQKVDSPRFQITKKILYRLYVLEKDVVYLANLAFYELQTQNVERFAYYIERGYRISKKNPLILSGMSIIYCDGYDVKIDLEKAKKYVNLAKKYESDVSFPRELINYIQSCITLSTENSSDQEKDNAVKQLVKLKKKNDLLKVEINKKLFVHYLKNNQIIEAKQCLDFLLDIDSVETLFYSAQYEFVLSNYLKAEEKFKSIIDKCKTLDSKQEVLLMKNILGNCYYYLGSIYENCNNEQMAISYFQKGIAVEDTNCSEALGWLYYKKKDYEKSLAAFKSGFQNTSQPNLACLNNAGYILHHHLHNKKDNPIEYYRKALSLGYNFAAKNLADFYRAKHQYLYAISFYKKSILSNAENSDESVKLLNQLLEQTKTDKGKGYLFLTKKMNTNQNNESLLNDLKEWVKNRLKSNTIVIDDEIINQFAVGFYNAISLLKTNAEVDYSSAIGSLSKGLEFLLKQHLIQPYIEYMQEKGKGDLVKRFIDDKTGLLHFTLGDINKYIAFSTNLNKKELSKDFSEFLDTTLNISKNQKKKFIIWFVDQIKDFNQIRNSAIHTLSLDIEQFCDCINILFFKKNILQRFITKLK